MRRLVHSLLLCASLAFPVLAQENKGEGGSQEIWLIVNFVLLAGGLAVMIGKNAGPFFRTRLRKIREEIVQGEDARQEAQERAAEVDRKLANLDAEIAALRADSQKELEIERERMRERTSTERSRITASAEQEIAAAGKTARAELKRYSAELAIGLAERKIRTRINAETQDAFIGSFVEMLNASRPDSAPSFQA